MWNFLAEIIGLYRFVYPGAPEEYRKYLYGCMKNTYNHNMVSILTEKKGF